MVWQATPATSNAATHDLTADKDTDSAASGDQPGQVLVRFDNLFGNASGQVPAAATIHSAKLILSTPANASGSDYNSSDTMRLHRMIRVWSDTATWDSLVGGIANDNVEAASSATFAIVPSVDGAPAILDVSADVELFRSGGAVNRGWLIRASSTGSGDGWTFKSSETTSDVTLRPALEIVYSSPTPYASWAAAKSLTSANNGLTADPDHDGAINLVEFAFNLNPLAADAIPATAIGTAGLPFPKIVAIAGGRAVEINFLRRKGTTAAGLIYTAKFSADLQTWSAGLAPTVTPIDADWDRVTVRDSAAASTPRRFARVELSLTL
jgi:hypothetical protein